MSQTPAARSYGQFDPPVDRVLHERYFLDRERPGFFVESGAFDGETECSCKFFEETLGWRGINVEPVPRIFEQLMRNRPRSINVNAALASTRGTARFTAIVHPEFGELCTNGSLHHTPEHAAYIEQAQWETRDVEVRTLTWDDLMREHGVTEVDLLVLDVEGTELDVIAGMQGSRVLPRIFCVEHGHLGVERLRQALEPLGYDYDFSQDVNSYFIRRSRMQGWRRRLDPARSLAPLVAHRINRGLGAVGVALVRIGTVERLARRQDMTGPVEEVLSAWFARELGAILARPERPHFECEACGAALALGSAPAMAAECLFTGLQLNRRACPHCGLVFGPLPLIDADPAELGRLYDIFYRYVREGASRPFQEKTFYLLNPSRRGRYLNYACGSWQEGLSALLEQGWDLQGFEPFQPQQHPRIVRDRAAIAGQRFDGVFSHNYIEHVQSLRGMFAEMDGLLAPGGTMAHSTPCYEYLHERSPFHLYFLAGTSVERLCERTGFVEISRFRSDREDPGLFYEFRAFRRA